MADDSMERACYGVSARMIGRILEYIEAHLLEALTPAGIAAQFYMSPSALSQLFTTVCDTGIMEYIRNRRISLAGQALLNTDARIIDLALEYGYETPEAFTKAFSRVYGFPPSFVRRANPPLKQYHPLRVEIKIQGGWVEALPNEWGGGQDGRGEMLYHGVHNEERSLPMNSTTIHVDERQHQEDWRRLRDIGQALTEANIPFKVDGKTMVFAHGLEFPLDKICLTFLWKDEQRVLQFFGFDGKAKEAQSGKTPSFKYFDAQQRGMSVRCMFYGGVDGDDSEVFLYRNTDLVDVDGLELRVQSLEFYFQNGDRQDKIYARVAEYLNRGA